MKNKYKIMIGILAPMLLLASGCAPMLVKPVYFDPILQKVDHLTVLPVFDARKDKSYEIQDVSSLLKDKITNELENRQFSISYVSNYGENVAFEAEDLENPEAEWLKQLGPNEATWLLLLSLDDLQSSYTFGSMASAELSGIIIKKDTGAIVWKNKGLARRGQGGLIGLAMKDSVTSGAIQGSVRALFQGLPNKGGPLKFNEPYDSGENKTDDF